MGGSTVHYGDIIVHIEYPDVTDVELKVNGKTWKFDFDHRFGPLWLRRDGEPRKHQNPPKEVWDEFSDWLKKHEKETKDGTPDRNP